MSYNPWPLGKIPKELQRPELDLFDFDDAREIVGRFEDRVAKYAGSKYAVTVDSCTNALFLCLMYHKYTELDEHDTITIPKYTYISVPQSIIHAGFKVKFSDDRWVGAYRLWPYPIYDGSVQFTRDMYISGSYQCLSFQIKKVLPIGKGGMILTDDREAYKWFKKARFEGRDVDKPYDKDIIQFLGWNMYMTPEDAARGMLIMNKLPENNKNMADWSNYPDLTNQKVFK